MKSPSSLSLILLLICCTCGAGAILTNAGAIGKGDESGLAATSDTGLPSCGNWARAISCFPSTIAGFSAATLAWATGLTLSPATSVIGCLSGTFWAAGFAAGFSVTVGRPVSFCPGSITAVEVVLLSVTALVGSRLSGRGGGAF